MTPILMVYNKTYTFHNSGDIIMNKLFYKTINFWYGVAMLVVGILFIDHSTKSTWLLIDVIFIVAAIVFFLLSLFRKPKPKKENDETPTL